MHKGAQFGHAEIVQLTFLHYYQALNQTFRKENQAHV